MTTTVAANRSARLVSRPSAVPEVFSSAVSYVEDFLQYRRDRRALLALDNHMLKDIGISRADAERIAGEPFDRWRGK